VSNLLCIKHNGKAYCWNFETERIEVFTTEAVLATECPKEVVDDLMRLLSQYIKKGTVLTN
jgi:hypothetical protein